MKVLIVDDEPLARMLILEYLKPHQEVTEINQAGDGFEALKAITNSEPDLVFLDIQMPKLTGFEVLELTERKPAVIFTTAFDKYALQAFEAAALDYLLKPIAQDRFDKAFARFLASKPTAIDANQLPSMPITRIAVRERGVVIFIPTESILYFEAQDDLVRIVTKQQSHYKTITLAKLEASLPKAQFVRVHRSYIIQIGYLQKLVPYGKSSYQAIMDNGDTVAVSEAGYKML